MIRNPSESGAWELDRYGPHERPVREGGLRFDAAQFVNRVDRFQSIRDGGNHSGDRLISEILARNARLLRDRYKFKGELRAIGDVLRDQLFFMARCGFDAFAIRADKDPEDALQSLKDFSVTYQAATDEPLPLFRRR